MKNNDLLDTIFQLRKKSELNKLVVFVGAGVSCNVEGMPSWNDLIVEMAKAIGYSKCNRCKHKAECKNKCRECSNREQCYMNCRSGKDFSSDDYLRIPQYLYNSKRKQYQKLIRQCISNEIVDAPLSKSIFEINPSHIITTNYDTLLESSTSEFRDQYDVVISDKDLLDSEKSHYIIKMHGDINRPETIVLKEQDYLNYSQDHILIELFVKALLADHTILFLGYSLNDYNIKLIISWLNYLRTKNGLFAKGQKIGYVVLDEETVDKNTLRYFLNNSIEVLNIQKLQQVPSIPSSIVHEKGKRLFSFLSIIKDPALEEEISSEMSLVHSIDFIENHRISDYVLLLKYLHIKSYSKTDSMLRLLNRKDYLRLESFFKKDSDQARKLKLLLVNVGITTILYSNLRDKSQLQHYSIDLPQDGSLLCDKMFSMYLHNNYSALLEMCETGCDNKFKTAFFKHFAIGYSKIHGEYDSIGFDALSQDDRIVFLHNSAILSAMSQIGKRVDLSRVQQYISRISSSRERQLYQHFLELYKGNKEKRLDMLSSLEKLKKNVLSTPTTWFSGGAVSEIYVIKNIVVSEYFFYYTNHLFTLCLNSTSNFFEPYIEAVMCANSEEAERPSKIMGEVTNNEKYPVDFIDIDIITKYSKTKQLMAVVDSKRIKNIHTKEGVAPFVVECFLNLTNSILTKKTYGCRYSSISALSNLAILLARIDLTDKWRKDISLALIHLFADEEFNKHFWSIACPEFRSCLKAFAHLISAISITLTDVSCVKSIINSPEFYEFAIHTDFKTIRSIVLFFLGDELGENDQKELTSIIDNETYVVNQINLLRLFYSRIIDDKAKKRYKTFLSTNFDFLEVDAIYDFAFNNWLIPSDKNIQRLINDTLESYRYTKKTKIRTTPDPVVQNLDCLYILHIMGLAPDLSALNELAFDKPHLQFLLNPDSFDYSLVDFSDYMWENFARQPNYMKYFVEHKKDILPRIKDRIANNWANETEKKILYGFMLDKETIWEDLE